MKIKIRELELDDANFILEIENNKSIWKVSNTTEEYNLRDIEIFISKNHLEGLSSGQKRWIIATKKEAVGCIDIFDYDAINQRAGIGIVIHPKFQNQKIGQQALALFIKYARKTIKLHQLYCTILEDNIASKLIFEKQGFKITGRRNEWTYFENNYYDELFYQLIFE